jgi:signal transduction histidine kinase
VNTTQLEPGLLKIFRLYAGLRILTALSWLIITQVDFFQMRRFPEELNVGPSAFFILVAMILLLGYLSWPWLERKLGGCYLPLALVFATADLLIEDSLLLQNTSFRGPIQPWPFLFILLIIIAWQYRYRWVVFFSLATMLVDIVLMFAIPQTQFTNISTIQLEQIATFGSIIARTFPFLILGYIVTCLMNAQRNQRQALADANLMLVRHAATLEQLTISRERNRLSRELHDTLAHTLSALNVQIDALLTVWEPIPTKAHEMLEQLLETTRSGLDETRRALRALRDLHWMRWVWLWQSALWRRTSLPEMHSPWNWMFPKTWMTPNRR